MSKRLIFLSLIAVFSLSAVFFDLAHSREKRVIKAKANKCIDVMMSQAGSGPDTEWYIFAENKCDYPEVIGKKLKVLVSQNVTVGKGEIINLKRFIVPAKQKKLIFMATKSVPAKKGRLWWKLIK